MSDDTQYFIQFNLYYATEGGFKTGHSNVTAIKISNVRLGFCMIFLVYAKT